MTVFLKSEHIVSLLSDPRLGRTMDHTLPAAEVVAGGGLKTGTRHSTSAATCGKI